ncbi:MAG: succinylglutamate desuccinylase [Chlorobiaceae bacterium]|nr:succinylglutamate desuccinylase [Chlorobiaceae bacterium]NTV59678.1 succinylglutamate desuccinylase [Chlorobiaceae bacterium]
MVTESFGRVTLSKMDGLPAGFEVIPVTGLDTLLPGPTLIRIRGRKEPPLFISVLLHGNEISGFLALQEVLKPFSGGKAQPARTIFLFIGNVAASAKNIRRFAHEPDYNRIWNGGKLPEQLMAHRLLDIMKKEGVFACIDMHNNTGKNPHYSCINRVTAEFLNLALLFSPTIVFFTEPHEVISKAFSGFCPSVTVECGLSGEREGTGHLVRFLELCLQMDKVPDTQPEIPYSLFHTTAKISLREEAEIFFGKNPESSGITLVENLDSLNFRHQEPGTFLGYSSYENTGLLVTDNRGRDVTEKYFALDRSQIRTTKHIIPSMLTKDKTVIRQDCLGYIMEHYLP